MFPLRDHNPSGRTPYVTWGLIAVNAGIFAYMLFLGDQLDSFIQRFAFIPSEILAGRHLETLITAMFLHASIGHLLGNMLFLHVFGDNLEARLGRIRYLGFYLICGLAGSGLQLLISGANDVPNLGASGAIAGLLGGYLVLYPLARIEVLWFFGLFVSRSLVPAWFMLGYWIVYQFIFGLGSVGLAGGVAYFAHIGGFAAGYLIIRLLVNRANKPRVRVIDG